jgi:hypothetical protein
MPVYDKCHNQVVRALEKAGWIVSETPYTLDTEVNHLFVDIEARRAPEEPVIVVEVKCFPDGTSDMTSLYNAVGQYFVYRSLLRNLNKNRRLYLAIPTKTYQGIFRLIGLDIAAEMQIDMIVVNLEAKEVEEWIEH